MSCLDIVAIGASAGGQEALEKLLLRLPPELPAALVIVLHRPVARISYLREILARLSKMPIVVPEEGECLRPGTCYLGLPDRYLTVGPDTRVHLLADGFYRGHCIDALFQSLARHAGPRTIGVILSGMLKDGSLGLSAIKEAGGVSLVQSPEDAAFPDMPRSAIERDGPIDFIGPIDAIAEEICRRVGAVPVQGTTATARYVLTRVGFGEARSDAPDHPYPVRGKRAGTGLLILIRRHRHIRINGTPTQSIEHMINAETIARLNDQLYGELDPERRRNLQPASGSNADQASRLIVERAPNAMIMVDGGSLGPDRDGKRRGRANFRLPASELLARSVEMLVPERLRVAHAGMRAEYFLELRPRTMGAGRDPYGLRKDGREFPVEIGLNPIETEHGTMVLASVIWADANPDGGTIFSLALPIASASDPAGA